jgi:hypothetical protein
VVVEIVVVVGFVMVCNSRLVSDLMGQRSSFIIVVVVVVVVVVEGFLVVVMVVVTGLGPQSPESIPGAELVLG